jgi:serine/threonine protein kinase
MLTREADFGRPDTTWDATLKILDIGLGRELFDEDMPEAQIDTQLTQEGSVLGTPDYLAPEQAKDARSADIRADVYSIGCVLYHCLAGRPPFAETNITAQMLKHALEKPEPLTKFVPDLPPALLAVIDRMMAKSPDQRYQTPAQAAAALKPILGTGGATPSAAAVVPAFKQWLETESHLDLPELPPEPVHGSQKPRSAAVPVAPAKPGGPAPVPPLPPLPAPPKPPVPGPVKPAAPPRPIPVAPARPPMPEEVDVELVPEPMPAPPVPMVNVPGERPLWQPDRRDWIMLATGAAGVLFAVGVGYGLARLARKKPEEPPPEPGE